jgi:hypothetical protein
MKLNKDKNKRKGIKRYKIAASVEESSNIVGQIITTDGGWTAHGYLESWPGK